jgi:transcriptional regulator with XRE-family HTH domain
MCESSHTSPENRFFAKNSLFLKNRFDTATHRSYAAYMLEVTLGQQLEKLRLAKGLSFREMGDLVGASPPHIRDIEQGNRRPSDALLEKLAAALETDLDELLKYSTRPPSRQMEELIEQDTQYSLAFRKFVDAVRENNIQPSEIMDLSERLPKKQ